MTAEIELTAVLSTVGWSDLALFCGFRNWTHCCLGRSDIELYAIFENGHYTHTANQVFFCPIPKHQRIWPRAWQSFHFQKITGTLKEYFFENLQMPFFYILQRTLVKKKIHNVLTFCFRPPKWAKLFFTWTNVKSNYLGIYSFKLLKN